MADRTEGGKGRSREGGEGGITRDNNISIAPKLTGNSGATTRPVTTLQTADGNASFQIG